MRGFQNAFQDTGSREHAEDKLRHLMFTSGNVDTFIAQFELLAEEATYPFNTKLTLTLFASKLPFKMMDHILKVVRPHHFQGWADAARQYHQDNMAVQNIKGIFDDTLRKSTYQQKKPNPTGFTPQQWAKITRSQHWNRELIFERKYWEKNSISTQRFFWGIKLPKKLKFIDHRQLQKAQKADTWSMDFNFFGNLMSQQNIWV